VSRISELGRRLRGTGKFRGSLWRGMVISAPILIIGWILYTVVDILNAIGERLLTPFVPPSYIVFGTGLLVIIVLIFIVGRIDLHFEGRQGSLWQNIIRRVPFLGPLFTAGGKALSLEELGKLTPCKFWLSDTTPHYGFIVREQRVRGAETEIDVYRPNVPTIVPGDLMPLKKRLVIKLANSPQEILQKLASGGFFSAAEEIPVPWEDETEEGFLERIRLTPLEIAVKRIMADASRQ
jgi:uncharacterized membrane protein